MERGHLIERGSLKKNLRYVKEPQVFSFPSTNIPWRMEAMQKMETVVAYIRAGACLCTLKSCFYSQKIAKSSQSHPNLLEDRLLKRIPPNGSFNVLYMDHRSNS